MNLDSQATKTKIIPRILADGEEVYMALEVNSENEMYAFPIW